MRSGRVLILVAVLGTRLTIASPAVNLVSGQPVISELRPGGRVCYIAVLPDGLFGRFRASQSPTLSREQVFLDLVLEVTGPGVTPVVRRDAFEYEDEEFGASTGGTWSICVVAGKPGASPTGRAGRFSLAYDILETRAPEDEVRMRALQLLSEARALIGSQKPDELRDGVARAEQAAGLWGGVAGNTPPPGTGTEHAAALVLAGDGLVALADYPGARARYKAALAFCSAQEPKPTCAEALSNSAVAAFRMGDIDAAAHGYDESLALWRRLNRPFETAVVENNQGLFCLQTGEIQQALDLFLAALPGIRWSKHSEAITLGNVALAYMYLGRYEKAETYLQQSLPLLTAPAERVARGKALMNLGQLRAIQGNPRAAEARLIQARDLLDGYDMRGLSDVALDMGELRYRDGNFQAAIEELDKAKAVFSRIHDVRGLAGASHWRGKALAALGRLDEALTDLNDALHLRLDAALDDDAAATLLEIGRVQRRAGRIDDARASLNRALAMGEKLRVRVASPDLRASWSASRPLVYEELVDLTGSPDESLEIVERARARSFLDVLERSPGGRRAASEKLAAPDPALRERLQQITGGLSYKSLQLAQLPATADSTRRRASLVGEIDRLDLEYNRVVGEVQVARAGPNGSESSRVLSSREIQALIGEDTVLLEYFLGEQNSYLWVVTKGFIGRFPLPSRSAIEKMVGPVVSLSGQRSERLRSPGTERQYASAAAETSRVLLGPASQFLSSHRLAFALDGILDRVPFAALPDPAAPGMPVGITHQIVSIPSASALHEIRRHETDSTGTEFHGIERTSSGIAIFADPVFNGDPRVPSTAARGAATATSSLPRLPFSLREAGWIEEAAAGRYPVVRRFGFAAGKGELSTPEISGMAILHLATHAVADDIRPELSGIYFSEVNRRGAKRDGFLSLYEIYGLRLQVQMATLSACGTGLGRPSRSDGIVGLKRAFLMAGVPRVVVSLWAVDDEGTALFMREFYRSLFGSANMAPAEALRSARRALWTQPRWSDPAYWSAFVLEGDWNPIRPGGVRMEKANR